MTHCPINDKLKVEPAECRHSVCTFNGSIVNDASIGCMLVTQQTKPKRASAVQIKELAAINEDLMAAENAIIPPDLVCADCGYGFEKKRKVKSAKCCTVSLCKDRVEFFHGLVYIKRVLTPAQFWAAVKEGRDKFLPQDKAALAKDLLTKGPTR